MIRIEATSTISGWFICSGGSGRLFPPFLANRQVPIMQGFSPLNDSPPLYGNGRGGSVIAPDGSYIGIDGAQVGLGVNVFGHDCIAVGTVVLVQGVL